MVGAEPPGQDLHTGHRHAEGAFGVDAVAQIHVLEDGRIALGLEPLEGQHGSRREVDGRARRSPCRIVGRQSGFLQGAAQQLVVTMPACCGQWEDELVGTADRYRAFAEIEAAGSSAIYERAAQAVASDRAAVGLLDAMPPEKRQPNLLFAALRFLGGPVGDPAETLGFIQDRWEDLSSVMSVRSTQTNEPARTAVFLPIVAALDGPVALIEVGASAGLCLFPDRYRIRYGNEPAVGPAHSPVTIEVETHGPVPIPRRQVEVVRRIGIDLHPLDAQSEEDLAWLSACIWPEHTERQRRLLAAARVAAQDPPEMIEGDLVDMIGDVLADLPRDVTPVVFHSAVLNYLAPLRRVAFSERLAAHRSAQWISNEGPGVIEWLSTNLVPPAAASSIAYFVVGIGGVDAVGISDPHGRWVMWQASA